MLSDTTRPRLAIPGFPGAAMTSWPSSVNFQWRASSRPPPPISKTSILSPLYEFSTNHVVVAAQDDVDRFRVRDVFLYQNTRSKSVFGIAFKHRYRLLHYDRPVIYLFIDQMHGAARNFGAVGNHIPVCVFACEGRQQRRMDVQDLIGKLIH